MASIVHVENNQFENFKIYVKDLDQLINVVDKIKSTNTHTVPKKLVVA
jgi:hypothetical protein